MIAGRELSALDDTELTKLRREHIGFVFQFFNLLPMLTAQENILLPLAIAGQAVDPGWYEELVDTVGLRPRLAQYSCRGPLGSRRPLSGPARTTTSTERWTWPWPTRISPRCGRAP